MSNINLILEILKNIFLCFTLSLTMNFVQWYFFYSYSLFKMKSKNMWIKISNTPLKEVRKRNRQLQYTKWYYHCHMAMVAFRWKFWVICNLQCPAKFTFAFFQFWKYPFLFLQNNYFESLFSQIGICFIAIFCNAISSHFQLKLFCCIIQCWWNLR